MDRDRAAKAAPPLGSFSFGQMAPASVRTENLSTRGNLEAFGHGLLCLDAFGTSHKSTFSKRARNIETGILRRKG
jgi:hypothetical protein